MSDVSFDPLRSRQAGYEYQSGLVDDATRRRAGAALGVGNYAGAASALGSGGLIPEAVQVGNVERAQTAARREIDKAEHDEQVKFTLQAAEALARVPAERRNDVYMQTIRPIMSQFGFDEDELARLDAAPKDDETLSALTSSLGGTTPAAPSGYRYVTGGKLEAIPGGPASAENQRWQVTPYGMVPPPGWSPPAGSAPSTPEYVDQLPPGVRPRSNPAPSARSSGGAEMRQPTTASYANPNQARSAISQAVPGVTFTSGTRSAEHNAKVGGVPTSNHIRGRAWDLVPPQGMSMGQLAQKMRSQGLRALDEGDHVHVSW